MNVLDGTQSCRTQAPPAPSRSTTVTSAPFCAATNAASYPAGPPPMMTTRFTHATLAGRTASNGCRPADQPADTLRQYSPPHPGGAIVIAVRHYAAYGSNL